MLQLSEILIANPQFEHFSELMDAVKTHAAAQRFFRIDIKPPYPDTPANWEDRLESAFSGVL